MDNIAIVGMGCLFPDYSDKEKFWKKLINGERFVYQYDYQGTMVDRSGLVHPDGDFFEGRLPEDEIRELDAYGDLFKWVAYVVDEALKQSGYAGDGGRLQRTGMVFGCLAQPIRDQFDAMYPYVEPTVNKELHWILRDDRFAYHQDHRDVKIHSMFTDTEPARHIAQARGLGGPALMFSAACATPLYAMKLAAMYLNAGEADMIIAGSHCSNESDEAACGLFDTFGILCGADESRPLNKNSNGIVTGSGAGAFALKRLADAEQDGDDILAVIENIGLSNDGGSGSGILSPSTHGQLVSYEIAYADGLSHDVDYIECHATGTQAGDQSEVDSIEQFFNTDPDADGASMPGKDKVLIGAMKANTGHFLTATGCASVAKVILSLREGVIPATIGVDDPIYDRIALTNTPWEAKSDGSPRRAGINAFGFGGVNAHLVLSEHVAGRKDAPAVTSPVRPEKHLAIVGMGLNIGNFRSVEDFLDGLTNSTTAFEPPEPARLRNYSTDQAYMDSIGLGEVPKGSYINNFEFDTMRFKMPVSADPFFLRRDMLLLETAAEALDEAGVKEGSAPRTAVIIDSALDFSDEIFYATSDLREGVVASLRQTCPEMTDAQIDEVVRIVREDEKSRETADTAPGSITSVRGNRISSHWGFTGPSFTVFEQEVSIFRCLELAEFFIAGGLADQAVIGVVSFAGEIEHLFAQKERGMLDMMADRGIAEGAVVLVLKPMDAAVADGDRIYAAVDGVALSSVSPDGVENVQTTLDKALARADVGEHEMCAVDIPHSYDSRHAALIGDVCRGDHGHRLAPAFAAQNVEDYLGFGFSLAAAASMVRQALQLYLSCGFDSGGQPVGWGSHGGKHVSLVTGYTCEKQFGCAVLSDSNRSSGRTRRKLTSRLVLLPLRFSTPDDLRRRLLDVDSASEKSTFRKIYESWWAGYMDAGDARTRHNTAVLVCYSKESLHDEVKKLAKAVPRFDDPGFVHVSPRGSYCAVSSMDGTPGGTPWEGSVRECADGDVNDLATWFGLTPQIISAAGLDCTAAWYRPKNRLLRLGATLLSCGVPFDLETFLSRFDFYPLNRPSHVLQICNGLPAMYEHLSDPQNRVRIGFRGAESPEQLEMPIYPNDGAWDHGLAVVGLGFHVGAFESLDCYLNGLMTSNTAFSTATPQENDYSASPEVLIDETLAMALRDSGLSQAELGDTALVILTSDSPDSTVRITQDPDQAPRCGVGGWRFTVHGGDIVFFQGLTLAHEIIRQKLASAVCVCTAPAAVGGPDPDGPAAVGGPAEGAIVVVLRDRDRALAERDKIYACVGLVTMGEQRMSGDERSSHLTTVSTALETAGVGRHELRVADVSGPEFRQGFDEASLDRFGDYMDDRFATTDVDPWLGRPLGISIAASFVKQALQLSFFTVFVFDPDSSGPSINDQLARTLWGRGGEKRASLIAYAPRASGGNSGCVVLAECVDTFSTDAPYPSDLALLPVACSGPDDLCGKLTDLTSALTRSSVRTVWENAWRDYQPHETQYTAVLAFTSGRCLGEEASAMLAAVQALSDSGRFVPGGRYESKLGSFLTADPYGRDAKIVFMNPPYTLHYFLSFYRLVMMFPQYRKDYLGCLDSSFQQMVNNLDFHFGFSGVESGMIWVVRKLASDLFGLSPDILIGASLGEITSLVAYDSIDWETAGPDSFHRLFSALKDVFTFSVSDMTPMYCKGPLDEIRRIAAEHGDVYISLVASPDGAFIAGTREAVDRVIEEGGFLAWRLSNDLAIHTPLVEHFYEEVYDAARDSGLRLRPDKDFEIYSTYLKRPIGCSREDFSEYAATILIKECDFYGLLELLYSRDARVFIDMGTGGSCHDWAHDTFEGRDATVFSMYPPILDPVGQMFRIFARLLSNHVKFDCSAVRAAFTHPFMDDPAREAIGPGTDPTAPSPSVSTLVHRSLNNNVSAYTAYADNEMLLLDWLRGRATTTTTVPESEPESEPESGHRSRPLWDRDQILEITGGSPSAVWGTKYEALDTMTVRARMPMPPFLFVDRVTGIDAEYGVLRPSWIETETDINDDCIMLTSQNMITPTLLAESSHSAILLLSYMGIDLISGGGLGYRILNTRGEYHDDIPLRGETVHSRLEFTDFVNSGSMTLVTSKFWCHNGDKLVMTFDLLGGLFTAQDLEASDGNSQQESPMPAFTPLEEPYGKGVLYADSEGPLFYPLPASLRAEPVFVNPKIQMVDRIIALDPAGGDYGLGLVVAEKDIDENHWAFTVHFLNDPVFPGTLLSEASSQIQFMYAVHRGFLKPDKKYYLLNNRNVVLKSSFRGEVKPVKSVVRYVQQFREVTVKDNKVVILSDLDVYWQGRHVSRTENCCLDIEEVIG